MSGRGRGYEAAKERLKQLERQERHDTGDRNEATTRLHLVDELLTGVLGWPKSEIAAEVRHDGRYADYVLGGTAGRMIVEAKREGVAFELPAGVPSGTVSLETLLDSDAAVGAAIHQVLAYCQERGVPIAGVSNGHQLLSFFASRQDGVPPLEGKALVFASLKEMLENYRLLWDNLSPAGVDALRLHATLGEAAAATPPAKLSARIPDYPGYWGRNDMQTELKILGDLVLQDILSAPELEQEFLKQCYSSNDALSKYALVSKEILEARYSALDNADAGVAVSPARRGDSVSPDLSADVSAASLGKRPLILLGDVGVGKSIFIRHFVQVDAREVMDRSVVLYINFGGEPALADDLNEYVMDHFVEQLRRLYDIDVESDKFVRSVYKHDLQSFKKGVHAALEKSDPSRFVEKEVGLLEKKLAKRDRHLQASLRYITTHHKRQVVVFLDNIDQRDFEFQERVFLIGQGLAETWPATVFLSLRPDTFHRSRTTGSLTAYQPRVFTIAPPDLGQVITKRLRYCRELVQDSEHRSRIMPVALASQAALLAQYLELVEKSFRRKELVEFVDNLSGGNIRLALGFLNTFVGSGHVDTNKIMRIVEEEGRYIVPLHEFVRAITYGDGEHYDPSASPIANLFEIGSPDPREHFLLPLLMAHVERKGEVGHQDGFVDMRAIMEFCQGLGFLPAQVEFAIRHGLRARLLQQSSRFGDNARARYRITTVGAYTYKKLLGTFVYCDAVIIDTPITDDAVAQRIGDVDEIGARLNRSRLFAEYLDSCWSKLATQDLPFSWPEACAQLKSDHERIERTLAKRGTAAA